jgi:amino acid adenylation domain-containing protein
MSSLAEAARSIGAPGVSTEATMDRSNETRTPYPRDTCIHQLFERQAESNPDAVALVHGERSLSYRELNGRANQLARYLRKLGVGPDMLVGICMHRCPELVVAILGVLKAGGAYVPLDPTYPKKRLAAMFEDIDMPVLLTQYQLTFNLPARKAKTIFIDTDLPAIARERADNLPAGPLVPSLAYVIFTSGSTGRPKAAAVFHRGWTNLMNWFVTEFKIGPTDKVLVVSSFSFDITQRSIVMPLIAGGQLHLLGSVSFVPGMVCNTIGRNGISLMNCAPSMFYLLIEEADRPALEKLRPLRALFLGGEPISASRLRHWAQSEGRSTEIVNVYGVAECTDVSSSYRLRDYQRYAASSVPAGKPIFNTQIYILDEALVRVPFGEPGEICIAGDGVGRGYINDAALTEKKFVANPFGGDPGALLYRTGDLGRFLPDGTLEFVGRVDHQVKIRGLRIDLGDIETTLRQHHSVKEAVVMMSKEHGAGDQRLVAYVVARHSPAGAKLVPQLRSFVKERLPQYMVPSDFVMLEKMPLSPNGKIDRDALQQQSERAAAGASG